MGSWYSHSSRTRPWRQVIAAAGFDHGAAPGRSLGVETNACTEPWVISYRPVVDSASRDVADAAPVAGGRRSRWWRSGLLSWKLAGRPGGSDGGGAGRSVGRAGVGAGTLFSVC